MRELLGLQARTRVRKVPGANSRGAAGKSAIDGCDALDVSVHTSPPWCYSARKEKCAWVPVVRSSIRTTYDVYAYVCVGVPTRLCIWFDFLAMFLRLPAVYVQSWTQMQFAKTLRWLAAVFASFTVLRYIPLFINWYFSLRYVSPAIKYRKIKLYFLPSLHHDHAEPFLFFCDRLQNP